MRFKETIETFTLLHANELKDERLRHYEMSKDF